MSVPHTVASVVRIRASPGAGWRSSRSARATRPGPSLMQVFAVAMGGSFRSGISPLPGKTFGVWFPATMRIAFTHNIQMTGSEDEAEFDTPETVAALTSVLRNLGHDVEPIEVS